MRYASAKKRVLSIHLQMTIAIKTKTSSAILKILEILIQKLFSGHIIPKHPNLRLKLCAQQPVV
jgi:hypothetical protein